jgi:hypothetical protein
MAKAQAGARAAGLEEAEELDVMAIGETQSKNNDGAKSSPLPWQIPQW